MFCKSCGNELIPGSKFCNICGTKVETDITCLKCGTKMPMGSRFCIECGSSLEVADATNNVLKITPLETASNKEQSVITEEVKEESIVEVIEEIKEEPVVELTEEIKEEPVVEVTEEIKEEPVVELTEEIKEESVVEVTEEIKEEPVVEVTEEIKEEPVVELTEEIKEEPVVEVIEEIKEEPVVEITEEIKEEPIVEVIEEIKEEPVVEITKEIKEEPIVEVIEEIKEETIVEVTEEIKEEPIVEVIEEIKEETIVEVTEEIKEEPIAEVAEEIKEEPIVEVAEEIKEDPVVEVIEEIKEEPVVETIEEIKEDKKETAPYAGLRAIINFSSNVGPKSQAESLHKDEAKSRTTIPGYSPASAIREVQNVADKNEKHEFDAINFIPTLKNCKTYGIPSEHVREEKPKVCRGYGFGNTLEKQYPENSIDEINTKVMRIISLAATVNEKRIPLTRFKNIGAYSLWEKGIVYEKDNQIFGLREDYLGFSIVLPEDCIGVLSISINIDDYIADIKYAVALNQVASMVKSDVRDILGEEWNDKYEYVSKTIQIKI